MNSNNSYSPSGFSVRTSAILKLAMPLLIVLLTAVPSAAQQAKCMSGLIVDADGAALAGATVTVASRNIGTIADQNGYYYLDGLSVGDAVNFDFIGFVPDKIIFDGIETHNVVMHYALESLEDAVVVGYGSQKKVSVTGALSQIMSEALVSKPAPTLSTVIGGTMPGIISRQSTGEPGNDYATIYIRGMATWQDKSPLILVDGVERDINLINPQEIDSFTVLKDASATAVYGVRGANGVIIINTKKGKVGRPEVSFRTEHAVLQGLRFPEYINGYEFASLMNEAVAHATSGTGTPAWTEAELQKFRDGSEPYDYPDVNWIDQVLKRNAYQTINNLSINGGNETIRYWLNVGYTSHGGLFQEDAAYKYKTNTRSDRYNLRSTVDVNLSRSLVFSLSIGAIFQDKTYPGTASETIFQSMRQNSPISMPVRNPDGTPGSGASAIVLNPWALTTQSGYAKQFQTTLQGTASLSWDLSELLTEGLSLSARFSYDMYYENLNTRYISYEMKRYMGTDEEGNPVYNQIREQGSMAYSIQNNSNRAYYWDVAVNYNRTFASDHNVGVMLLFNRRDYKDLTASSSILNLPYRRQGLAGRLTYDYAHRYMAEFNFGYNGSENFRKGKRYGFFPSVSLGWNITNEPFVPESVRNIVNVKLRGSYGVVGNDRIGGDRFLYISTVNYGNGSYFGDTQQYLSGIYEGKIGADVTWEKAYKANAGFDIRLFNDSLTFQFDWFNEDRKDILLSRGVIPIVTGITAATYANLGEVNNRGLDAMLEWKRQTKSGFWYSVYGNLTYAHNTIIEDDTPIPKYDNLNTRGTSIGQTLGYVALGLFKDEEDIANSPKQTFMTTVRPGDIKYADLNNDNVIDAYDRTYIGCPRTPEIMYGFGFSMAYKGWDLSVGFTGAGRTSMFLTSEDMWPYSLEYPKYNVSREYYDHRWVDGRDNSKAKYPAVINGNNTNNYQISTLYMRNARYLKLKNAEIGYRLPSSVTDRIKIGGVRFFLNGLNLLCFDQIRITDPESDGGTGNYPQQRTMNIGVQVDF